MGRRRGSRRTTVEQCLTLSIFSIRQAGVFDKGPGHSWAMYWSDRFGQERDSVQCHLHEAPGGALEILLSYSMTDRVTGETTPVIEPIHLVTTACHFGGERYWFLCPLRRGAVACCRWVGKLYLPPRATYFGCRHCHDLTYRSCQQHDKRVDALAKLPMDSLLALSESGDLTTSLLAMRATRKRLGRR